MDLRVIGEDEEVIHIDNEPSFGNHVSERVIHKSLEGGRGVAKSKEHDSWFEEPLVSDKGSLPLVSLLDPNIVISRPDIHFGEDRCSFELVDEVGDQGKGIGILDGMLVQVAVVLTRAKGTILFSYEEKWGCLG